MGHRPDPTYPTLQELPLEAHFAFECPHCRNDGVFTALHSTMAMALTWQGQKALFTGITCPQCKKSFTLTAERQQELPPPTPVQ